MEVLHLRYQVSHKRSPGNGGSGRGYLIEPEAKSNGSQDLHRRRVGDQDSREQSYAVRTTKRKLDVLNHVDAEKSKIGWFASPGRFSQEIVSRKRGFERARSHSGYFFN